jgi:hypothetical protein
MSNPLRKPDGTFIAGHAGIGGRPAGRRNRLTETVTTFLSEDFEVHGRELIQRVREKYPQIYLSACVSLLPKQLQTQHLSPFNDLTEQELGLLENFLRSQRAKPVAEIDGEAAAPAPGKP